MSSLNSPKRRLIALLATGALLAAAVLAGIQVARSLAPDTPPADDAVPSPALAAGPDRPVVESLPEDPEVRGASIAAYGF